MLIRHTCLTLEVSMHDLIKSTEHLPTTFEDLHKFILIGKEALKAQKAKIRAIEKAGMAAAAMEAARQDTQDIADILLDAEVKLGEMLEKIEPIPKPDGSGKGTFGGREKTLPLGITKKQSHQARQLADNKDIVEEVKKKARKEGRVPVATDVMGEIEKKKKIKSVKFNEVELISDHFKRAYDTFFRQIMIAKSENWKKTSKKAALEYVSKAKDFIIN